MRVSFCIVRTSLLWYNVSDKICKSGTVTCLEHEKPKYLQLKEYLICQIKENAIQPGSKIPSENKLSSMFDISRHTVRRAISELENEGWLAASQGKGTFVRGNRKKRNRPSHIIGIVTTYLDDYIFPSIIRGMDEVLGPNGYSMVLGCTGNRFEKEKACLDNLLQRNIDGIIVETTKSALANPNIENFQEFNKCGIPIVFIHGKYEGVDASVVLEDDEEAGFMAASHLLQLGHRKVGGLFKMDDYQGHARYQGFLKAHIQYGVPFCDNRVLWFDTKDLHYKLKKPPNELIDNFLDSLTSIVCYNDQVCLKLIDIVREKGTHIPDELSLVSFDDSELAVASEVKLTTVAHPKELLGKEAAYMMLKMISEPGKCRQVKMKPELVVRASTSCHKG